MSLEQWLLGLHMTGAFLLIGGAASAIAMRVFALRRRRPSEIALFLGLTLVGVYAIYAGILMTLVFGLWLVHESGYGYLDGWIVASIVLWVVVNALGGAGGKREAELRKTVERMAAEGDEPRPELTAAVRNPRTFALSWASGFVAVVVLVLMIWKPGA